LLAAANWITMAYSVAVFAPLTTVCIAALCVAAGRANEDVFVTRLVGGLIAGFFGLLAYDLIRLAILVTGLTPFNPFRPIEVFGLLILDRYQDSAATKAAGWVFHIWNGLSFAAMYTLAVGRGRLAWAFAWAMMLEAAMLASYPSLFRIALEWPFVVVSFVGHAAYGLAIGVTAKRVVRF
jgi:hypothetical protein